MPLLVSSPPSTPSPSHSPFSTLAAAATAWRAAGRQAERSPFHLPPPWLLTHSAASGFPSLHHKASGIFRQSSKSISVQFHLPNRIPPPTQTLARTHVPSPFLGVRAGVGDAGAARGRRDSAGAGAGGQRVVGGRCGVAGAVMVGVGVPRGVVQPGGDAAVAGLRGVPGVAGAAELP